MKLVNRGTPIAIPSEGIGLLAMDQEFEIEDELGERLLHSERFERVEETAPAKTVRSARAEDTPKPEETATT